MALALKRFGSLVLAQMYRRGGDCACGPSRAGGILVIRGLPVYTDSKVQRKENDTRVQEKNVDAPEKNEKITKEEQVFSASKVARTMRRPTPPTASEGSGGKTH